MTAAALDEGRYEILQRQSALLHHVYAVLESAAQDPAHEMQLECIQDPDGPALAPWAPTVQSAVVAHHKKRMARRRRAAATSCRDKRFSLRQHQEGSASGARPAQTERVQGKGRPEGRARRGMIRPGATRPLVRPTLTCPTSQKVLWQEVGVSCSIASKKWGRGRSSLVFCISVPFARLPSAVPGVGYRLPAAGAANVSDVPRPRAPLRADLELQYQLRRAATSWMRLAPCSATGLACREDPSEFKADKRGRSLQVSVSILEGVSFGSVEKHSVGCCAGVDAGSPPHWPDFPRDEVSPWSQLPTELSSTINCA